MEKEEKIEQKPSKIKEKLKNFKQFMMTTTNGMAIGLFGTLIIGTIINLFAQIPNLEFIGTWSTAIQGLMGAGIGLGVALSLKKSGVATVATMAAGFIGNYAFIWVTHSAMPSAVQFRVASFGDPLSCYISSIIAVLTIELVCKKKTPVDLILIPLIGLISAIVYSLLFAEWIHFITVFIGWLIEVSTNAVPFLMCILISTLTGMALTAPISSVAICVAITLGNTPLAAAAALIGCSTQMVGFAVQTARDNKWGSVLAVGIGTSMLQFKNIIRKPIIWLPTIITSALLGPLAMIMPLQNQAYYVEHEMISTLSVGAGMGTSGLVGPLNFLTANSYDWRLILMIIAFCIIAPAILVFGIDLFMRKMKWIESGDLSLKNDI